MISAHHEHDLESRIQSIRDYIITLTEVAKSYIVHVQHFSVKIHSFEMMGAIDDLKDMYAERNGVIMKCIEIQEKLQAIISNVSELAVRFYWLFIIVYIV